MMLRYSLNLDAEADAIEAAVQKVLEDGYRTIDIMSDGCQLVGCDAMGDAIVQRIQCNKMKQTKYCEKKLQFF